MEKPAEHRRLRRLQTVINEYQTGLDKKQIPIKQFHPVLINFRRIPGNKTEVLGVKVKPGNTISPILDPVLPLAVHQNGVMGNRFGGIGGKMAAAPPVVISAVNGKFVPVGIDDKMVLIRMLMTGKISAAVESHTHPFTPVREKSIQ